MHLYFGNAQGRITRACEIVVSASCQCLILSFIIYLSLIPLHSIHRTEQGKILFFCKAHYTPETWMHLNNFHIIITSLWSNFIPNNFDLFLLILFLFFHSQSFINVTLVCIFCTVLHSATWKWTGKTFLIHQCNQYWQQQLHNTLWLFFKRIYFLNKIYKLANVHYVIYFGERFNVPLISHTKLNWHI